MFQKYFREHTEILMKLSQESFEDSGESNRDTWFNRRVYLNRSAISRAYYSCFHMACERSYDDGWIDRGNDRATHRGVINCLHHMYNYPIDIPKSKSLPPSEILAKLKKSRTDSDYKKDLNGIIIFSRMKTALEYMIAFHNGFINMRNANPIPYVIKRSTWTPKDLDETLKLLAENDIPHFPEKRHRD